MQSSLESSSLSRFMLALDQTSNSYFICDDPPTINRIFARIRNYDVHLFLIQDFADHRLNHIFCQAAKTAPNYPHDIAGLTVTSVIDLTTGYDSTNPPSFKPALPLSSGHMIQFRAENPVDGTKIVLTTRYAFSC